LGDLLFGFVERGESVDVDKLGDRLSGADVVALMHINFSDDTVHGSANVAIFNGQDAERTLNAQFAVAIKQGEYSGAHDA